MSCHKATELIEKKQHSKLSLKDGIQLKVHLMMCKACALYEKQSELISKGIKKYFTGNSGKNEIIVNPELKERIVKNLK